MTETLSIALIFVKANWISALEYRDSPYHRESYVKIIFPPDRCRFLSGSGRRPAAESADTTLMPPRAPDALMRKTAWWPRPESNGHVPLGTTDFKSVASTCSATGPWCAAFHGHHLRTAKSRPRQTAAHGLRRQARFVTSQSHGRGSHVLVEYLSKNQAISFGCHKCKAH